MSCTGQLLTRSAAVFTSRIATGPADQPATGQLPPCDAAAKTQAEFGVQLEWKAPSRIALGLLVDVAVWSCLSHPRGAFHSSCTPNLACV